VSRVRVVLAGVSTRAAAESAARAGFDVTAIDAFADLDQHPAVHAQALPGPFTARAAAEAARSIDSDAVAYLSNFENHPAAVHRLTAHRTLWGNPPEILKRVRDPILVAEMITARGFAAPSSFVAQGFSPAIAGTEEWVVKPLASGGGHGIRRWHHGDAVPRGTYLQQFVDGTPGSVVFAAAAGRTVPLGVFQQLIGDSAFGTDGFRYCGNILAPAGETVFGDDDALAAAAAALAAAVSDEFGLVGVNGIDFVARDGIPYPIEVNPRWCASMELVERAYGLSVFAAHGGACDGGVLPDFDLVRERRRAHAAFGKAVVFARHDLTVADTRAWCPNAIEGATAHVRDVPQPGTFIGAGRPICTVFAEAPTAAACYAALVARAERVYADLD
jgi:predicted ATP-grasp superfamily ATP-dependent carboligase